MDKVLIVDGDASFLKKITDQIAKLHQFIVLTSNDSKSALEILAKEPVSILVIDIEHPMIDGLELLAFMTRKHPGTPCIVMTQSGKPWFRKPSDQKEILYHIEKTDDIGYIASAIMVGLNIRDEGMAAKGITVSSILPLIEIEQKTCRLEVTSPNMGKGFLYFEKGVLLDSYYKGLDAEKAAKEISRWSNIAIQFSDLPRKRSLKRVGLPLMAVAGATWHKEEITVLDEEPFDDDMDSYEITDGDPDLKAAVAKAIQTSLKRIRGVKGYLAVGILDANANVLADDAVDQTIDLRHMANGICQLYSMSMDFASKNDLTECQTLALHCPDMVIHSIISMDKPKGPFYIVGITSVDGNWMFMKVELENMSRQLIANLVQ